MKRKREALKLSTLAKMASGVKVLMKATVGTKMKKTPSKKKKTKEKLKSYWRKYEASSRMASYGLSKPGKQLALGDEKALTSAGSRRKSCWPLRG